MSTAQPNRAAPLRVALVEDDLYYPDGLKTRLHDFKHEVTIVQVYTNKDDTLKEIAAVAPDVALVDLKIPENSSPLSNPNADYGIELIEQLGLAMPKVGILVISTIDDNPYILFKAIEAGAHGYVIKNSELVPQYLVGAIKAIMMGKRIMGAAVAQQAHNVESLTWRQREVLTLLAQGKTTKQIQQTLRNQKGEPLAEATVDTHIRDIFTKLHIAHRIEFQRHRQTR